MIAAHNLSLLGPDNAAEVIAFTEQEPLVCTDVGSIASMLPPEPRVLIARANESPTSPIIATAVDDGLAVSIYGQEQGVEAIAHHLGDVSTKLVISGRVESVRTFLRAAIAHGPLDGRQDRPELLMAVDQHSLVHCADPPPVRIANADDLPLLHEARRLALAEEYDIPVAPESELARDLTTAVGRAVSLGGVAIWVEDDRIAFTAQLIAKTPHAAMFGDLYTDPALRGAGRATRALSTFCSWLMTESAHVTLRVGTSNEPAVRLYERVGFRVVEPFLSSVRPPD